VQKPKEPVRVTADPDIVLMGAGGITSHAAGAQALKGKVVLADGITPAMGAQVLYWRAHQKLPSLFAMTNALGDLQPRGLWRTGETSAPESAPGPDSDTVIAFLPGTTGATIQTVSRHDEDLHLVLPHPIILKGRVTVGGISPLRRPGLIRIVAKHSTNEYLSLDTTCDADGNFELAGLTQGSYEVQAALDDIWLSSPVSLVIGSARPKPMRLNIAQPGAPVRVEVRDPSGHPLPAASIKLERDGPLAVLWPKEWVSDSAGSVWFPTLEAGRHKINVGKSSIEFTVPAMPAATINVRITAAPESYGATSPRSAATR
jgi:hypothetical protein